jgi:hypothetical protein
VLVVTVVYRVRVQGWSYVGDRLLSAVVPYEETGWYDGQMWVKPPEVNKHDSLATKIVNKENIFQAFSSTPFDPKCMIANLHILVKCSFLLNE